MQTVRSIISRRGRFLLARTFALSTRNLCREGFQPVLSELAKVIEPGIDLLKGLCIDCISPARAGNTNRREPAIAQHLEMLEDRRLGDAEVPLGHRNDVPGRSAEFENGARLPNFL